MRCERNSEKGERDKKAEIKLTQRVKDTAAAAATACWQQSVTRRICIDIYMEHYSVTAGE